MSEIVRVVGKVRTNRVGSECEFEAEFERDEWEGMSEDEREEAMREAMWDSGQVDWDYRVADG